MSLHEYHEGPAKLVSCTFPKCEYQIPYYRYDHYLELVERRRGFPLVPMHSADIQIRTPEGLQIPEGRYFLETETESVYLQNLGGGIWRVVSCP
jgi:hypothetical protein